MWRCVFNQSLCQVRTGSGGMSCLEGGMGSGLAELVWWLCCIVLLVVWIALVSYCEVCVLVVLVQVVTERRRLRQLQEILAQRRMKDARTRPLTTRLFS